MVSLSFVLAFSLLAEITATQHDCGEHESCTMDIAANAASGSAMLQLHAGSSGDVHSKATPPRADDADTEQKVGSSCSVGPMESTYLLESQACLPRGLQEKHLQALRRHALFLSAPKGLDAKVSSGERDITLTLDNVIWGGHGIIVQEDVAGLGIVAGDTVRVSYGAPEEESFTVSSLGVDETQKMIYFETATQNMHPIGATVRVQSPAPATSASSTSSSAGAADPTTASLDAAGFKLVTSLCCPSDMETWFNRLLASMNLQICSKAHIQGLMHWFSCVPDMDFSYLLDIINNGNPCKYWALTGATCPALSPECEGKWCR